MHGRDWEVILTHGEILRLFDDLDVDRARQLASSMPVFLIGYLMPVVDLSDDSVALEKAIAEVDLEGPEYNTVHLFGSREGTRAVVFDHHH